MNKCRFVASFNNNKLGSSGQLTNHTYEGIPSSHERHSFEEFDDETQAVLAEHLRAARGENRQRLTITAIGAIGVLIFFYLAIKLVSNFSLIN